MAFLVGCGSNNNSSAYKSSIEENEISESSTEIESVIDSSESIYSNENVITFDNNDICQSDGNAITIDCDHSNNYVFENKALIIGNETTGEFSIMCESPIKSITCFGSINDTLKIGIINKYGLKAYYDSQLSNEEAKCDYSSKPFDVNHLSLEGKELIINKIILTF